MTDAPDGDEQERPLEVVVTVDDGLVARLAEVIERLEAAGMEVTEVHEMLGTLSGRIQSSALSALGELQGVHIEASRRYRLPPPDTTLQGGLLEGP